MAVFEIQDAQGRTLEIEGEREPTQDEAAALFSEAFKPAAQSVAAPNPYNLIGEGASRQAATPEGSFLPAFEPPQVVKTLIDKVIPSFKPGSPDVAQLIQMSGLEPARATAEAVAGEIKNAAGAILSPGGVVTGVAAAAAPVVMGPVLATTAVPIVTEGVKEAVTGESMAERAGGATKALLGATAVAGGALGALREVAPLTAQAVRDTASVSAPKTPVSDPAPVMAIATTEKIQTPGQVPLPNARLAAKFPIQEPYSDKFSVSLQVSGTEFSKGTRQGVIESLPEKLRDKVDSVQLFQGEIVPTNVGMSVPGRVQITFKDKASAQSAIDFFSVGKPITKSAPTFGIVPEGAQKLAALQEGQRLIDQERIKTAVKERDVLAYRDFVSSPEFEFRKIPAALDQATKINEAELLYRSRARQASERFEEIKGVLSQTDREQLTKALFSKESQDNPNAISELPENLRSAASEIRQYYNAVRSKVIEDKQASVMNELSGPQLNALRQVQDGMALDEAVKANGLKAGGRSIVESAVQEINELKNWGIEDYTTHIERGSYRVVTDEGVTVHIAETRAEAAIKADRYLKANPDVKSLTIDDSFNPGVEFPTKLSKGQYFRLIQRLKDNLGESASEIQRLLHENGSIVAVKPTNKYAGPMQQRRGILKGEEDVFDVLPVYAHVMEKKLALDPVLREARQVLPSLPENARTQLEDLIGDVKGRKSPGDKIVDQLLSGFGGKPFAYSRGIGVLRQISNTLKLGYRPVAAAVNRISGLQHTWTKVGTRYLKEGREFIKTPEGKALVEANEPYLGIEASFAMERMRPTADEPLYKPLGMFQAAERYNRPEAFGAFYKFAEGELGLTGQEAAQYARNATRFAQFTYNTASLPRALRGPTGRFLFQFKPYLVKELEFISSLRGAEIPRYLAGFLAVGGPRAALYTLKSLPLIGAWVGFDKLEDWLNQEAPRLSRGAGGALGVDVSPSVAFQFPQTVPDLFGPTISDIARLWTGVVGPALKGEDRDWRDVQGWATKLAPALNYWSQLVESASSEAGWITDDRGRPQYKPSRSDYAKLLLGAKPLEKSIQEVEQRFLRQQEDIARKNKARLIDDFLDAVGKKDGARIQDLSKAMAEFGVTPESVKSAAKNRAIEPQLRLLRSLSKATRAKEAERFAPKPEE